MTWIPGQKLKSSRRYCTERSVSTSNPQFTWRTTVELMPYKGLELYSKQNGSSAETFRRCATTRVASSISKAYQPFLIVPVMDSLSEQIHLSRSTFLTRLRS